VAFPENVLAKSEKVERNLHPHWLTVFVPTIFGLLLAAACIAVVVVTPDDETGNRIQWIAVAVLVLVAVPAVIVPYLRWRTTPETIERLAQTQENIVEAATAALRPGGTLVYSTCTLSPRENEERVAATGLRVESERLVLPHRDRTDGFYIARMRS